MYTVTEPAQNKPTGSATFIAETISYFPPKSGDDVSPTLAPEQKMALHQDPPAQETDIMFLKAQDAPSGTAPQSPPFPTASTGNGTSVLASDLKIIGELICTGSLEVQGEFDGNITAAHLSIGAGGLITGVVRAAEVDVQGRLEGRVECDAFVMRAAAVVTADINCKSLVIEAGSSILGRITMTSPAVTK